MPFSRFYGIVIKMYFDDHQPPHFHAEYAGKQVLVTIETFAVIAGELPPRAMGMVTEWALLHKDELKAAWNNARNLKAFDRIDPLP